MGSLIDFSVDFSVDFPVDKCHHSPMKTGKNVYIEIISVSTSIRNLIDREETVLHITRLVDGKTEIDTKTLRIAPNMVFFRIRNGIGFKNLMYHLTGTIKEVINVFISDEAA